MNASFSELKVFAEKHQYFNKSHVFFLALYESALASQEEEIAEIRREEKLNLPDCIDYAQSVT